MNLVNKIRVKSSGVSVVGQSGIAALSSHRRNQVSAHELAERFASVEGPRLRGADQEHVMRPVPTLPGIGSLHGALAQIRPDPQIVTLFKDWTRFTCDNYGRCTGEPMHGLFCADTLMLSRHIMRIDGAEISHRSSTQTSPSTSVMLGVMSETGEDGDLPEGQIPEGCVDFSAQRQIDGGMAESIRVTNHAFARTRKIHFCLELNCPIIDNAFASEMKKDEHEDWPSLKPKLTKTRHGIDLRFEKKFGTRRRAPTRELRKLYHGHPPHDGETIQRALNLRCFVEKAPGSVTFRCTQKGDVFLHVDFVLPPKTEISFEFRFDLQVEDRVLRAPDLVTTVLLPIEASQAARASRLRIRVSIWSSAKR